MFCDRESFSAGRLISFSPAATRHHFIRGAQKKTVLGPVRHNANPTKSVGPHVRTSGWSGVPTGWFMNDWNLDADALAAAPDIFGIEEKDEEWLKM